jgi:hypothetical protein
MSSPFRGMEPYLENPEFWPEFHHRLITAFQAPGFSRGVIITTYDGAHLRLTLTPQSLNTTDGSLARAIVKRIV